MEQSAANILNPSDVTNLFCKDGILWGTVSRIIRSGYDSINEYFEYFARIPGLRVVSRKYNITRVTDDVFINNAEVDWTQDGATTPLEARMAFIYKRSRITGDWCIFELHSSEMPEVNENVKKF